jgi:hypothetical protein
MQRSIKAPISTRTLWRDEWTPAVATLIVVVIPGARINGVAEDHTQTLTPSEECFDFF